jgi:NADH-quinone oxidoreductase subunit A
MSIFGGTSPMLAQAYNQWAVIGILLLCTFGFALGNLVLSAVLGPSRKGKTKDEPYESGMDPVGTTHQRFNVRFYLVAMIFLVFDVEVLFLIPWITIFPKANELGTIASVGVLFGAVVTFTVILLVAYIYAWGKGVLKWD